MSSQSNPPALFFYSYCGQTPFHPDVVNESIVFLAFGLECISCLVCGMICHLLILCKQARIESKASVYVLKDNKVVSSRRHHRNIVSFMGHFASFILTMVHFSLFLNTFYFFVENEEILATLRTLVFFFFPATEFLVYPLVETMFSESLRRTFSLSSICW